MARSIRASASTTVDRDVDDVFEYVADVTTMDEWVVGVADTKLVSGDGGNIGDVYEYDYTYRGQTSPIRVEITELEAPVRVAMRALDGPFPFEGELTLSRDTGRTRVTNTIEPGADGRATAVMFALFAPLLRWTMRRRLRAELDELKRILESSGGESEGSTAEDPGTTASA